MISEITYGRFSSSENNDIICMIIHCIANSENLIQIVQNLRFFYPPIKMKAFKYSLINFR